MLGAAATGAAAGLWRPGIAQAQWGAWPSHLQGLRLPAERRASRVLELFFYGGLCPWDSFYCVPSWGQGQQTFLHAFDVDARFGECGGSGATTRPFGVDGAGTEVHLGPWTHPLWSRPDLLARMRVVAMRHDQLPHETAIPLALTGSRLGSPALAGTGSAVQRHFAEGQAEPRVAPHAYVIHPGGEFVGENLAASTATGQHPVAARPWDIAIDKGPVLSELLERPATAGYRDAHDALLALYTDRYAKGLVGQHTGRIARSPGLDAWRAAQVAQGRATEVAPLLGPSLFGLPLASECGRNDVSVPMTTARAASQLLTGEQAARYVLWIDGGMTPSVDGGHDTHREHLSRASLNYAHSLRALAERINAPGESDPDKLDLQDTLVAITTEFGRSPHRQPDRDGLNHWPHGYVTVLLGGPVDVEGAGISGVIEPGSAIATDAVSPADLRASLLDAMGIYPFDSAGFGLGDLSGSPATDDAALQSLRGRVLGVQS